MKPAEKPVEAEKVPSSDEEELLKAQKRAKRWAALKAAEGIWKDRTDIPKDGVEFERMLRGEWD